MVKSNLNPKVSVVIPVYNGANYLKEALDSALAQTYKNIEVIVVNDGSTDGGATEIIAKSYGDKIRYFSKKNGGVATALNLGIQKMTGDYFSWLSHDDKYKPDRTEKMIKRLSEQSDVDNLIIASSYSYFTETAQFSPAKLSGYTPKHPLSYLFLGYINGCSILVPKKIIQKEGLFDVSLPTTQDFDYWFRILRDNKLIYLNEELTLSRSHDEQGSKVMLSTHVVECNKLWIDIASKLNKTEKTNIFGSELKFYWAIHDFLKANTLYVDAIKYMKKHAFTIVSDNGFSLTDKPDFIDSWVVNLDKSKKTIFFPIFGYYTDRGGLNKMIAMVSNQLCDTYNVVIASYTDMAGGYDLEPKISYIRISTSHSGTDSFEDIADLFDVDVTAVSHNCTIHGLELTERLKSSGHRVIVWNHEDYFLPYTNPKFTEIWSSRNTIFGKADAVVWLTNASCRAYSVSSKNGLVIPNFVHFADNAKPIIQTGVHNNIIAIARFDDSRKRINLLLKIYEKIISQNNGITLSILGVVDNEMPYSETESIGDAILRINSNKENIKVVGFVDNIEDYYLKSDIHILPSYGEGFGLTILESAHYGVPTAVFDNSGFDDIISDGQDGVIVAEADVDALAQRIVSLYKDKTALIEMKKQSTRILKKFDEAKIISQWKGLINNIIKDKANSFYSYDNGDQTAKIIFDGYEDSLSKFQNNFNYELFVKMKDERDNLMRANAELAAVNHNLSKEISGIYSSKRWKYIAKAAAIKNKLTK